MTIDRIAPEALKLSLQDRIQLASTLWESVEDPYLLAAERSDEEAIALAISRDAEIESGKVQAIPHAEAMKRLRL